MSFTLNQRVVEKLKALPEGPEKEFLSELMVYEVTKHSGERPNRGDGENQVRGKAYKEDIMKLIEKKTAKAGGKA